MKLEYFQAHGRALMIRLALNYCNIQFEDAYVTLEEMQANKAAGKYPGGQLPILYLDDGTPLT